MKNVQINNANHALMELMKTEIKGQLKFKLFKLKRALEGEIETLVKAVDGLEPEDEEYRDIMLADNETQFDVVLTEEELEPVGLTLQQVSDLSPFIKGLSDA